jgi:hypothetical protein
LSIVYKIRFNAKFPITNAEVAPLTVEPAPSITEENPILEGN